jgi:hypothetical protein
LVNLPSSELPGASPEGCFIFLRRGKNSGQLSAPLPSFKRHCKGKKKSKQNNTSPELFSDLFQMLKCQPRAAARQRGISKMKSAVKEIIYIVYNYYIL